ncbi:MAG: Dabb family protein [Bacteroidota bacterium]
MLKYLSYCCLLLLILSGCTDIKNTPEYQTLRTDLIKAEGDLDQALATIKRLKTNRKGLLIHTVYFKLQPQLTEEQKAQLTSELKDLKKIEVIKGLRVGAFQDLGDARAMADYGMVMDMGFKSEADYQTYQAHPLHQALKKNVGQYLAGPPVTYDYWMQ